MWYLICGILNVVSFLTILIYRMKYLETQYQLKDLQDSYGKLRDGAHEIRELASITKSSLLEAVAGYNKAVIFVDRSTGIVRYKRVHHSLEELYYWEAESIVDKKLAEVWQTLWTSKEFINKQQAHLEYHKHKLLAELQKVEQDSTKLLNAASTIELDDYLNKGG